MQNSIAIIGAGVSGLTCGVLFAERRFRTAIFAKEIGRQTTSAVAAAIWFPYDAEPAHKVIPWAMDTYRILVDLCQDRRSGVSMIELRQLSRTVELEIPDWASSLRARKCAEMPEAFASGFALNVPLTDTTIYLDYLANRFRNAGGEIYSGIDLDRLENVDSDFNLVINCTGIGARQLAADVDLEPHRGQVVLVPRIEQLSFALACDEAPLLYAIPRAKDCVLGGTNDLSADLAIDPAATARILNNCIRVLNLAEPKILAERVGLRPFRRSGIRLERNRLRDGRPVIHNYGHGGSGFTLSWGCAKSVLELAS
jgi:D-amino-acid oxidase